MLLKGGTRAQSPVNPKPQSLLSAHGDQISESSFEDQRERGSPEASFSRRRKRRRLFDCLSTDENGNYENNDALVDQDMIYKGIGGDITVDTSLTAVKPSSSECRPLVAPAQDQIPNATSISKLSAPPQGGRLKVTYARQRSFVDDDAPDAIADVITSADLPQLQSKRQKAETAIHTKPDQNLEEPADSQGNMMRSIYELRKAGSNARAVCGMEALLDDINGETGLALESRISRLFELIMKLQDSPYCRLFIGQGLDLRLLSCLESADDLAIKALIAAAILHLLVPSACLSKLHQTRDPRFSKLLLELLDQEGDLKVWVKKPWSKKPRKEQASFETSWEILLKSAAWSRVRPLSLTARVIGLQCLENLARHAHASKQLTMAVPPYVFWSVARILHPGFSASISKSDPKRQLDLQLALSTLEVYTIGNSSSVEESIWEGETLRYLKGFLPHLSTWREAEIGPLRNLTLRLYLNLMNNRPKVCEAFSTTDVVGALLIIIVSNFRHLAQDGCEDLKVSLDSLILALGSMINLAEWCHFTPRIVINLQYEDVSFLDILLQLYVLKQVEAQEVSKLCQHPHTCY